MKSYKINVNGQSYDVTVEEVGGAPQAAPARAAAPQPSAGPPPAMTASSGGGSVKAPMPGTLMSYKVAVGQKVKRGEVLLILEAMKMENEITAPLDGTVASLGAAEGASVSTGDVLIVLS
jgi:glutaconyl-CoA/methylmalonyl-CoA decarboxylase subunit gamma